MEKVKLIWDFRGLSSKHTATHFKTHLSEFFKSEKIDWYLCDIVSINPSYHYIFIVTDKVHLAFIKSALKPNRGQLVKAS
jgi:hypothetical protein